MSFLETGGTFDRSEEDFSHREETEDLFSKRFSDGDFSSLSEGMKPLSFPLYSRDCKRIQLWSSPRSQLLASVLEESSLYFIPPDKIYDGANPKEKSDVLHEKLASRPMQSWNLVHIAKTNDLYVWPKRRAPRRLEEKFQKKGWNLKKAGREKMFCDPKSNRSYRLRTEWEEASETNKTAKRKFAYRKERIERDGLEIILLVEKMLEPIFQRGRFPHSPAIALFHQTLQQKNLSKEYNEGLSENHIFARRSQNNEGSFLEAMVGNRRSDLIRGLFEREESLFETDHFFLFPFEGDNPIPFSNDELRQILRELAIGIYVYETPPFFSLHLNAEHNFFPLIHPAYENTLVDPEKAKTTL